jgi:Flp pilus assembly pilin Flp
MRRLASFLREERGATAIETMTPIMAYSIAVAGLSIIGPWVMDQLTSAGSAF